MSGHDFIGAHFDVIFGAGVAVVMAAIGLMWRKLTQQEINIRRLDHLEKSIDELKTDVKEDIKQGDKDHSRIWSKTSDLESRISSLEAKIDLILKYIKRDN